MKKMVKAMALLLCAVLLVVGSVVGTLAYLQMKTQTVQNTFAVGKVAITLQEYKINPETGKAVLENDAMVPVSQGFTNIKLVPGREIKKNPFITVEAGSEKCYLFVKVENYVPETYGKIDWDTSKWTLIDDVNCIYAYAGAVDASAAAQEVVVFPSFTCASDVTAYGNVTNLTIDVTAYAVQAEGFVDAKTAWANTYGTLANP